MDDSVDVVQATTATEPIASYRPDAKTRRYDRQLRLWASAGQRSLEQARVLLVGCDATGCQALKNLVLPGISHFTILSPDSTTPQDVATNFFLHPTSIGSSIASEAVKYLKELNPSVEGEACTETATELLQSNPDVFLSYTLIIASNLPPALELQLADLLWEASSSVRGPDIPLIAIRNSGFVGRVEIQLREHCIVDTHPESTHTLRIDQPFPALEKYARSLDLEAMDSMDHSHVPWVVLLVRAASMWKETHDGKLPETDEERAEYKASINAQRRKGDEENYDEAMSQAYRSWSKSEVPWEVQQLLQDDSVKKVSSNSKNLHILLHTLSRYLTEPPHLPPISPTLPDMHSSTASYIELQNLFKNQHKEDLEKFKRILAVVLDESDLPEDAAPPEEVEGFVKNVGGVGIIKGSPLRDSKEGKGAIVETITESLGPDGYITAPLGMHFALLGSERFFSTHERWPGGSAGEDVAEDTRQVEDLVLALAKASVPKIQTLPDEVVESIAEVVRGGFGTLPTTAALLGGVVAQETIKLITSQYAPLDNTVIFDLVRSQSEKWKF